MSSKRSSTRRSAASSKATGPTSPWAAFTHPVDRYARRVLGDVEAGALIVAGPLVRLACERHLRDRQTGHLRGLRFDEARASHVIAFFPKFLRLPDGPHAGEPFHLQPQQQFRIGSFGGWVDADDDLRFTVMYDEEGKGNGKTPEWVGYLLYRLVNARTAEQIFLAAVTHEQSGIAFRDAVRFVEASPALRKRIHVSVNNLAILETGSFIRSISSEHRSLDGKRISLAFIDEVHEHPTAMVCDKVRAGLKGQRNAQIVEATNAGYDRASVCWAHHELSRQVLEGTVENDAWFAYVCSLDEGDDPLTDPACWVKTNPNLGVSVTEKYLREQVDEANQMPTKAAIVLRLNFCVWTQSHTHAINMAHWHGCPPMPTDAELAGRPCYGALDLGQSDDFCAFARLWELGDQRFAVKMRFWIPQAALETYRTRPYDAWRRLGALEITEGAMTDYDVVERAIIADCRLSGVRELAYDRRFAHQLAQHLEGAGITCIDTPQGFQLNEALKKLLELIVNGALCHGNQPVLSWMASNLVVRQGRLGESRIDKEQAADKIDGIAALVMALDRVVRRPPVVESKYLKYGVRTLGRDWEGNPL
jgi:phage terminase large subunit-like protein